MAFSGQTWPTLLNPLLNKLKVTAELPVGLTGNGTFEYRTLRSAYSRYSWAFPARSVLQTDRETLLAFWNQMGGSLLSFLFSDPDHNSFSAVNIGTGTQLAAGAAPTLSTSTTGGTIAGSTTLTYGITALNAQGETTESAKSNITTGTGSTNSNTISWSAVSGATSYNVYQGGKLIGSTTALSFVDTGYPQGVTAPTVNGTGTQNYPLLVPVAGVLHPIWHPSGMTVSVSGWSSQVVNGQPVVQYPAGSCPLYGVAVTASGTYAFAARFESSAGYAINSLANGYSPGTSGFDAVSFVEVFE